MENLVKVAWDQFYESNDHLLFGSRKTNFELSTLHPPQVQIFRLWQIYLENVDTLLKVTHAPILQSQIIEAASDVTNIKPSLEALMFGIYCIAIGSLTEHECLAMFSSAKKDLLVGYHFACQQALARCDLLKTSERDCLTALYLYLVGLLYIEVIRALISPRSRSGQTRILVRCPRCLESLFASPNEWVYIASPVSQSTIFSRPRCGAECGGHWCYLTVVSVKWPITKLQCSIRPGIVDFH